MTGSQVALRNNALALLVAGLTAATTGAAPIAALPALAHPRTEIERLERSWQRLDAELRALGGDDPDW